MDPALEPAVPLVEGAAAIVFGFSFFGFLASRLPRCSLLGMSAPPRLGPVSTGIEDGIVRQETFSDQTFGSVPGLNLRPEKG